MKYNPIVKVKEYKIFWISLEEGAIDISEIRTTEEIIKIAPSIAKRSVISSMLAISLIIDSNEDHGDLASQTGWSEGEITECLSFFSESKNSGTESIKNCLSLLQEKWEEEFSLINKFIFDLESAIMFLSKSPENHMVNAFCPVGSKGFSRPTQAIMLNNPKAKSKAENPLDSCKTFEDVIRQLMTGKKNKAEPNRIEFPQ